MWFSGFFFFFRFCLSQLRCTYDENYRSLQFFVSGKPWKIGSVSNTYLPPCSTCLLSIKYELAIAMPPNALFFLFFFFAIFAIFAFYCYRTDQTWQEAKWERGGGIGKGLRGHSNTGQRTAHKDIGADQIFILIVISHIGDDFSNHQAGWPAINFTQQ